MQRTVVAVVVGLFISVALAGTPLAWYCGPPQHPRVQPCAPPPCTFITKMVPCTRTEIVGEVKPVTQCVPVRKIGYRMQKVLLKGTPVGFPCGLDPCTKCCPQPFCQVVEQKVPYVYFEHKTIRSFQVCYKPVCRPVMLPQTYMVQAHPMCQ